MPTLGGNTCDISILNTSDAEVGFMLARDKNGFLIYQETTSQALAPQTANDSPDYSKFPAEEELRAYQSNYTGGAGLEYTPGYGGNRYHYGINIDARFVNQVRLGGLPTTVTLPTVTTLSITNANMETAATGWTTGAGATTGQSGAQYHGGAYSWLVELGGGWAYQDIQSGTDYKGRYYTFTCWVYRNAGGAGGAYIRIDDGVGTSDSSAVTADSAWHQLSVTRRIDDSATRLRLVLLNDNDTINAFFDDAAIIQPTKGSVNAQCEYNGSHYATWGNILLRLDGDGDAYEYVWNSAEVTELSDIYAGGVSGTDYLFMCQGWNKDYWYIAPLSVEECDTVWTELVDTDVTASIDYDDYKTGAGCLKLEVATACAAGDILATNVISKDLSTYLKIGLWIKSSVALDANDIQILIDDTAKCASPTETLNVPAVAANVWTYHILDLSASPTAAAISVGVKMAVDKDAFTLRVEKIEAIKFLQTNITSAEIRHMVQSGATFYGSDTNSTIVSTANPLQGGTNWGTSKQIGEDSYDIVDIKEYGGLIYAKKSDCKVYYINSSGSVVSLITGQANLGGTNTARMFVWREEALVIPYGIQGLIHYDGSTISLIQPALYMTGASDFVGQVQAVAGDEQYLYAVVDNSTKIEVMAVSMVYVDGAWDWRWHTLNEITLTNCASAGISSVYKKRLWVGSDTGTESFYYVPVTTKYGSIASDTDMTYQTGGYLITPWLHFNLRGDDKAWAKITLQMSGTTDNIYWRAYYKKLGDSSWTEINSSTKFKTSPETVGYIPVDGSSNKPSSTMMQFKFEGVTNATATSPVLLGWDVQAVWYPYQREMIVCSVVIESDQLTRRNNIRDGVLVATKKTLLDELYNPATAYPRLMYTIDGTAKYVKALPPKRAYPLYHDPESGKDTSWRYDMVLEVVKLS